MPKKIMTIRMWILVISLVLAVIAISPNPWASGVVVKSVTESSQLSTLGIKSGEKILAVNGEQISAITDYQNALGKLLFVPVKISLDTDKGEVSYDRIGDLGFSYKDLVISNIDQALVGTGIKDGAKILSINGIKPSSEDDVLNITKTLFPKQKFILKTDRTEYATLVSKPPLIAVGEAETSNIKKGLDFAGGTRVLLKPVSDAEITESQISDLIEVMSNRLNVYGLADLKMRPASDLAGNKYVLVEIAGASREEVRDLMSKQGKFEAKIGDDVAFIGGEGDVAFVCRNDGSCSGIRPPCTLVSDGQYSCTFEFAITLSEAAAARHAEITKDIEVNLTESGEYLSKSLDLYLDDQQVDSLRISADLKGQKQTRIAISGPGFGPTEEEAYTSALKQMNKLQTVLITGSLPLKLEIVKLDTMSPIIGQELVKNSITVMLLAFVAVAVVIFFRYRKLKIVIPMIFISSCEVVLTLGVAALIQWNIDLASIAGIIAAVGTGVDDQVVITDEALRKNNQYLNWKDKIKRAFGIVFAAYATTIAAMIPLWNAGAGLIRGFAVTTIIGVTIGVFITRPAFASMIERLLSE